jgi:hypothetical protein
MQCITRVDLSILLPSEILALIFIFCLPNTYLFHPIPAPDVPLSPQHFYSSVNFIVLSRDIYLDGSWAVPVLGYNITDGRASDHSAVSMSRASWNLLERQAR